MRFFCAEGTSHLMQPLRTFFIFLDGDVLFAEDQLFIARFAEKGLKVRAQRFEDVHQRGDGGRGQIALQKRYEALGELAAVGQFFLRQPALQAQAADAVANVHKRPSLLARFKITKLQSDLY